MEIGAGRGKLSMAETTQSSPGDYDIPDSSSTVLTNVFGRNHPILARGLRQNVSLYHRETRTGRNHPILARGLRRSVVLRVVAYRQTAETTQSSQGDYDDLRGYLCRCTGSGRNHPILARGLRRRLAFLQLRTRRCGRNHPILARGLRRRDGRTLSPQVAVAETTQSSQEDYDVLPTPPFCE